MGSGVRPGAGTARAAAIGYSAAADAFPSQSAPPGSCGWAFTRVVLLHPRTRRVLRTVVRRERCPECGGQHVLRVRDELPAVAGNIEDEFSD